MEPHEIINFHTAPTGLPISAQLEMPGINDTSQRQITNPATDTHIKNGNETARIKQSELARKENESFIYILPTKIVRRITSR